MARLQLSWSHPLCDGFYLGLRCTPGAITADPLDLDMRPRRPTASPTKRPGTIYTRINHDWPRRLRLAAEKENDHPSVLRHSFLSLQHGERL